ncbi:tetratricopeptide repeat-containing sensor histidine kinase [Zunongwangia pacifica]|uniref:Oxygen sensor histidine kinase NreB n=1 Tax=Zunongwangia pacifica TaxID=2911062 RepID=A0A9X1ZYT2_9FLAO|nr:tetratricopeptide repeat protein [Zunongwangia pacifica]MCL6218906.1 tetratricopeptide repeat protein [Zunongwangia pacifica]
MTVFKKHRLLVLVLFLGIFLPGFGQNSATSQTIDSLSAIYQQYLYSQPKKAAKAAKEWLAIAKKAGLKQQQARAYYALGNLENSSGDYKNTVVHSKKTIELLKELESDSGLATSYNLLALGYKNMGNYTQAMESFLHCLDYAKKDNDQQQQANAYQNIATLYILQKEHKKAIENLSRATHLFKELGDENGIYTTLFNFANILKEQGRFEEAREHYKTVLDYRKKENNKTVIAYININLSQMLVEEKKYGQAVVSLKKTLKLLQELQFKSDMAIVYNDLGICEDKLGHTGQAIAYFQQALKIGEEQTLLSYNTDFYKNLAQLYKTQGDYQKALTFYEKSIRAQAAQNSLSKEKYVANLQERYETELKEARIKLLENEKKLNEFELQKAALSVKKQRLLRNVFIGGFVFVLISLLVLRRFYLQRLQVQKELYLQKEKNSEQQINQMIKDHKLAVIERHQQGQDEERERLAREIHDGIGGDLAGIKIAFENYVEDQPQKPQVKRILEGINNACTDVRALSHQLHPLPFSKIGFCSFLKDFIQQVSKNSTLSIQGFFYPEEAIDNLPNDLLIATYRVVQELINNICKHSEATQAEVQLTRHQQHLNILVNDNGIGFRKSKKPGIGLRNIKERLQQINGTIEIDSSADSGTSITINIPLKHPF